MTTRRVYDDKLESGHRDTGCGEKGWPTSCLNCELDFCRYDTESGGGLELLERWQERLVWNAFGDGLPIKDIPEKTGVKLRTVYRILEEKP